MAETKDIQIFAGGKWNSLLNQKGYDGTGWRTAKGGTAIYRDGQWYRYYERINLDVKVYVDNGTTIRIVVKSLPSQPFRTNGIYYLDKSVLTASLTFRMTMNLVDSEVSAEPLIKTFTGFRCDATAQTFTYTVPNGWKCNTVTDVSVEIEPDSFGVYAYRLGTVNLTTDGWHVNVYVSVSPSGAGTAAASNSNPLYGTSVLIGAIETNRDMWRFTKWTSGQKAITYSKTVREDYRDMAVFTDATKVIDISMILYVNDNGQVCIEAKTLQNRDAYHFATITMDISYADIYGRPQKLTNYSFELTVNGQEYIRVVEGTSEADTVYGPENIEIQPPSQWVVADIQTELDNTLYRIDVISHNPTYGTVRAVPESVRRNGSSIITATPYAGYSFKWWDQHSPAELQYTVSNIRADYSDGAWFEVRTYYMTARVASGQEALGMAKANPTNVSLNGSSTFTATPAAECKFVKWMFSDNTTSTVPAVTKSNISNDIVGTAYFERIVYYTATAQVAAGQSAMGTAVASPTRVEAGGSAWFTATPKSGYRFVRWNFQGETGYYTTPSINKSNIQKNTIGIATFEADKTTINVIGGIGMDFDENGNPAYYRINVNFNPDVAGTVRVGISGYVTFSDGDVEPFNGEITEYDQYYISTTIRYREDRYINGGLMQAFVNAPGYEIGTVTFNPSER